MILLQQTNISITNTLLIIISTTITNHSLQQYQQPSQITPYNQYQQPSQMDVFQLPDDYKPQKYLTNEEMEDITEYLKNHPLFMKELPDNYQTNEHLVVLQSLKEDEDPIEVAQSLNVMANKKLKQNPNGIYNMKDAYAKYTQAINLKCKSAGTNAKLHANRAAINMKLKNYGKVIQDCRMCLKFDENYLKGYYRYAKALIMLQKYEQCLKLLQNRNDEELNELRKQAESKLMQRNKKEEEKKSEKKNKNDEIKLYAESRKWKLMSRDVPLPEGIRLQMIDEKLSIPLMILYPEFKQFDLIASSFEGDKVKDHLKEMIDPGLPWDTKKEYSMETIEIYCEISEAVLMKIPKQAKIGEIAYRVPIKQALELHVICKDNQFYKLFTSQYKIV